MGEGIKTNPVDVTDGVVVGGPLVTGTAAVCVGTCTVTCIKVAGGGGMAAGGPFEIGPYTPIKTAATVNTKPIKKDRRAAASLS